MSRKHFQALAAMVKDTFEAAEITTVGRDQLAARLADFCAEQNERFDRNKFLAACGVGS